MKNIHLKITEKPSRLTYNLLNQLIILTKDSCRVNYGNEVNQHIYITSDEEIKKGDWFIAGNGIGKLYTQFTFKEEINDIWKKIILTTDADLIKDGVQTIKDDFLEWFVNNPSCEKVEVQKIYSNFTVEPFIGYKIIIPQEEVKQEQLTAVEWLVEEMINKLGSRIENTTEGCELFEQAKEIDKKDKHSEYMRGWKDGYSKQELKSE
jgi:hypothetical protein